MLLWTATVTSVFAFNYGDRVQCTANLIVRATASTSGTYVTTEAAGSKGTIESGTSQTANGYTWWYITWDNSYTGWSVQDYLQPVSSIPATPTSPTPGTTSSPGPVQASSTVTLSWGASTGATYYDLGVVDVATGTFVVNTTTTSTSYTATLTAGKTYKWNVAAGNSAGESAFTTVLYFQTPPASLPGTPSSPNPADGAVLAVQPATLDWADTPNANSYDVYLKAGSSSFTQVGVNLSSSQWSANETYDATSFLWYVVAKNGAGSTQGPTWSYSIGSSSGGLQLGARVMAALGGANVRDAQLDSTPLFLQYAGVHGTIVGGPEYGTAGGFSGNWWQINWDSEPPNQNGANGWSAESVISLVQSSADRPQPNFGATYFIGKSWYTASSINHFFPSDAPDSIGGNIGSLGNCTWYAYGRMLELGYNSTQLAAIAPPGQGNAYQ